MKYVTKGAIAVLMIAAIIFIVSLFDHADAQSLEATKLDTRWTHGVMAAAVTVERSRDDGEMHAKAFDMAGYEWGFDAVDGNNFEWLSVLNPHAVQFDSEQNKFTYLSGLRVDFLRGVLPGDGGFGFGAMVALADTQAQSGLFIDFDFDYDVKYVFSLGFPF